MTPRRNPALWLAPLLALVGVLTYYTVFARWPLTRDSGFVNLTLVALAVALSGLGLVRAWARGGWRIGAGVAGLAFSLLCAVFLFRYVFVASYGLPEAVGAPAAGDPIPAVTLIDDTGAGWSLDPDRPALLVFFRGHW